MIKELIKEYEQELITLRHTIHQHPELGLEEINTSELVAQKLTQWGYQVDRGLAKTGVVATLKVGEGKKRLGIRADMDALPIQEQSGKPWSSKIANRMHACGHDGHTTILLGAARYLAHTQQFNGTLHLIFQPAEEMLGGGEMMVKEGLFERFPCDAIFGLHNMPGYPTGKLIFQHGPFMASMDQYCITVYGKGGHGAMPQYTVDPIVVASHIILALQTIVSRNVDPQSAAVITVGSLTAGEAANVIPDKAVLKLSVRSLDPTVRKLLQERIPVVAKAQAESLLAHAEVDYIGGTPVVVNDEAQTRFAYQVAKALLGEEQCQYGAKPMMGSEDFAFMLEANPNGCYFFVGNGDGPDYCSVHNPSYDFNDQSIVNASAFWCALTQAYLR